MGVVSAAMQFGGIKFINKDWINSPNSQLLSLVVYICLVLYFINSSKRAKL